MLRRRPDDTFELRLIERAIVSVRPAGLSPERKEALRLRIMSSLEEQDAKSRLFAAGAPERWLVVPAGAGIAAMIFAAVKTADVNFGEASNHATRAEPVSRPYVAVPEWPAFEPNQSVTTQEHGWIRLGPNATIGIEQGTTVSYSRDGESGTLFLDEGRVTAASLEAGLVIRGSGWSAILGPSSTAYVQSLGRVTLVHAYEGRVTVMNAQGDQFALLPGASHVMVEPEPVRSTKKTHEPAELAPAAVPASSVAAPATGAPAYQSPGQGRVLPGEAVAPTVPPGPAVSNPATPPLAPALTQPAAGPGPAVTPVLPAPAPIAPPLATTLPPAEDSPPPFEPAVVPPAPPPPAAAEPSGQGGGSMPSAGGNGNAGSGAGENPTGEPGGNANGHDDGSNGNGNGNANGHNDDGTNGNGDANGHNDDGSNGNGNANANGHNDDGTNGNANGHNDDGSNGNGNGNANGHNDEDGTNGNGNANGHTDDGSNGNGHANGHTDDDGSNGNGNAKPPKLK